MRAIANVVRNARSCGTRGVFHSSCLNKARTLAQSLLAEQTFKPKTVINKPLAKFNLARV